MSSLNCSTLILLFSFLLGDVIENKVVEGELLSFCQLHFKNSGVFSFRVLIFMMSVLRLSSVFGKVTSSI